MTWEWDDFIVPGILLVCLILLVGLVVGSLANERDRSRCLKAGYSGMVYTLSGAYCTKTVNATDVVVPLAEVMR